MRDALDDLTVAVIDAVIDDCSHATQGPDGNFSERTERELAHICHLFRESERLREEVDIFALTFERGTQPGDGMEGQCETHLSMYAEEGLKARTKVRKRWRRGI